MKADGDDLVHSNDVESPLLQASESAAAHHQPRKKPLTLLPLIALIFFEVSGGPFGTEDAVAAGGPLLVLAGLLIFPVLWSLPEALITAELATAFPENSGYVAWVTAAFGPFWGFQEGFWSWLSGVTDNSIYPVMLADNLRIFVPQLNDGWPRMTFLLIVSLSLTYLNYRGLNVVGHTAMTTTGFIITPFVLLCGLAAPHAEPSNWLKVDWNNVQWGTYLNIMFWNLNYWDSISCLAGEVDNPSKTFPRALNWAVLLVVASYFLPTLAALGVFANTGDWELGYYGKVAQQVGGNWLAWWIVLAAAASQIGQFQAEMSSDSYQLQGMAERGFLPKSFARRSRHGTPTIGILLSSLGVVCLGFFSFVDILELLNAVYCLAELLEFAAYIWLRVKAPALPRPYKVPLPTWGLCVMLAPAAALLVLILVIPIYERNFTMIAATCGAMVLGFILYPLMSLLKERGWVIFADLEFDYAHYHSGNARTYIIHATGELNYDASYNAEYVDVGYDGDTGIRATGSSMDLGSTYAPSSRAPGSVTGSIGSFANGGYSGSPRSPIGPYLHLLSSREASRMSSAALICAATGGDTFPETGPEAVAAAAAAALSLQTSSAPAVTPTEAEGNATGHAVSHPPCSATKVSTAGRAAGNTKTCTSGNTTAITAPQAQQQPALSPAVAAMFATVAAAAAAGTPRGTQLAQSDRPQSAASARVNSFRLRMSSEWVSSEGIDEGEEGRESGVTPTAAGGASNLIELE